MGIEQPEHIISSSSEFDEELKRFLAEPADPLMGGTFAAPPVIESSEPKRSLEPRPHQVLAIAATLAAEFPWMFDGGDVLRPVRSYAPAGLRKLGEGKVEVLPLAEVLPKIDPLPVPPRPPIVIDSMTDEAASGLRPVKSRSLFLQRMGRPAGSKLARKAARGKL